MELDDVFDKPLNEIKKIWLNYWLNKMKYYNAGDGGHDTIFESRYQAELEGFVEDNEDILTAAELAMFKSKTKYVENYEHPVINIQLAVGF